MSIVALDIGGTKLSGGLINNQSLAKVINQATQAQVSQIKLIKQITNLLDNLINKQAQAISIGVAGMVDDKKGVIIEAINLPALNKLALKKVLEKRYKVPVYINNDANCFALGEKYFGQGKKYSNIAAITLGTGIGVGLIINNQLYSGNSYAAGEFGQIYYHGGIIEQYSSNKFFKERYDINGEALFKQALKKDKKSFKIFEEFGYHLGKALSIIVYAIDPNIIILGGSISIAFKFFEKSMKQSLKQSSYNNSYTRLKISLSKNPHSSLFGAAWLASQNK